MEAFQYTSPKKKIYYFFDNCFSAVHLSQKKIILLFFWFSLLSSRIKRKACFGYFQMWDISVREKVFNSGKLKNTSPEGNQHVCVLVFVSSFKKATFMPYHIQKLSYPPQENHNSACVVVFFSRPLAFFEEFLCFLTRWLKISVVYRQGQISYLISRFWFDQDLKITQSCTCLPNCASTYMVSVNFCEKVLPPHQTSVWQSLQNRARTPQVHPAFLGSVVDTLVWLAFAMDSYQNIRLEERFTRFSSPSALGLLSIS